MNPLTPALKAIKSAMDEANSIYKPTALHPGEWQAIFKAYTAVQAAHAALELERRFRGGRSAVDLTNLIAFKAPVRAKAKRRKAAAQ